MIESILERLPVLGVCGYSGAGKTTLIEKLIPLLRADGLAVAVIKHDAHGLQVDRPGKDTDRLFNAGATVLAHSPSQGFLRLPIEEIPSLLSAVEMLLRQHDIVIVEGHKSTFLPVKLWLCCDGETYPPEVGGPFSLVLERDAERVVHTHRFLCKWLHEQSRKTPVRGGLLLGCGTSSAGSPEQLPVHQQRFWDETVARIVAPHVEAVTILGNGAVPGALSHLDYLPAVPDNPGPFSRMLTGLRWDPWCQWLFVAGDIPLVSSQSILWLLDQRKQGRWAVLPKLREKGYAEPLFALYDWRARGILESAGQPDALTSSDKLHFPVVPHELRRAWSNYSQPTCPFESPVGSRSSADA